jgi:hypothetical protein
MELPDARLQAQEDTAITTSNFPSANADNK